jgi:hypothetical protein
MLDIINYLNASKIVMVRVRERWIIDNYVEGIQEICRAPTKSCDSPYRV